MTIPETQFWQEGEGKNGERSWRCWRSLLQVVKFLSLYVHFPGPHISILLVTYLSHQTKNLKTVNLIYPCSSWPEHLPDAHPCPDSGTPQPPYLHTPSSFCPLLQAHPPIHEYPAHELHLPSLLVPETFLPSLISFGYAQHVPLTWWMLDAFYLSQLPENMMLLSKELMKIMT